ncbi:hypothetical protein [Deinococcus sp.]|nr:hypothetical protein [Deinococcus sp.]
MSEPTPSSGVQHRPPTSMPPTMNRPAQIPLAPEHPTPAECSRLPRRPDP